MSLYATITRITDETSTVRVYGPAGATPLEQRIEHPPALRTSLNEVHTNREQASANVLTAAAAQLLAEHGFTVTDDWQRLGIFVPTYGAHATRADRTSPGQPGQRVSDVDPRAEQLLPGMTVGNPLGREPWVLDVLAVHGPNAEQMVTIVAVQDTVRVAYDWPVMLYTAEDADLESRLVTEEADRWQT